MLAGTIVPEGDRALGPLEAALILGNCGLSIKMRQQGIALGLVHPDNMLGKGGIDINRFATRFGVRADDGVLHHRKPRIEGGDLGLGLAFRAQKFAKMREVMHRLSTIDPRLNGGAQAIIGGRHIGKEGIAAHLRDLDRPKY